MFWILELVLAVAAWNRGWKGFALLPLVAAIAVAIVLTMIVTLNGLPYQLLGITLIVDIAAVITLGAMNVVADDFKMNAT